MHEGEMHMKQMETRFLYALSGFASGALLVGTIILLYDLPLEVTIEQVVQSIPPIEERMMK